jgi:DNA repair exonuclease SbcCD ATPase subunit
MTQVRTPVLTIDIDISKGIEELNNVIAAKEEEFYDCDKKITLNDIILVVFVELASNLLEVVYPPSSNTSEVNVNELKEFTESVRTLYNTKHRRAALTVKLLPQPDDRNSIKPFVYDFLRIWKQALLDIKYKNIIKDIKNAVEIVSKLVEDAKSNLCEVIDVSIIEQENDDLKQKLTKADETRVELSKKIKEVKELTTKIEVIKSEQEKQGAYKVKLEEESQQIADQLAKTKLANELNSIIFGLQSKILQSELERENQSNTGNKNTIKDLNTKLEALDTKNKKYIENNSKSSEEYTATLAKLEEENNQLVQNLENGKSEIQTLKNQAKEQEGLLEKLKNENEKNKNEIEESKNKLEADLLLAKETAQKAQENAEKELKSKELSEEKISKLKEDLENAKTELSDLKKVSNDVKKTNTEAENKLNALTQQIGMAKFELQAQETECTNEIKELSETVRSLEGELEKVNKENFSLHEQNTRLDANQRAIYEERLINIKTIKENDDTIADLKKEKEALAQEIDSAKTENSECQEASKRLEDDKTTLLNRAQSKDENIKKLSEENNILTKDINKLTSNTLNDYQNKIEETRELIKALKEGKTTIDSNRLSEGLTSISKELMRNPTPDNIKLLGTKINRIHDYAHKKTYSFNDEDDEDDNSIDDIIQPAQKRPPSPPLDPNKKYNSVSSNVPYVPIPPEELFKGIKNGTITGGGGLRYMEFQKLSNNNILYTVWVLVAFITLALSVYVTQVVMQRLEKKEYKHPINKNITFSLILTFVYSCIFVLHSLLGQSSCLLAVSLSVCGVSGLSLYLSHVFSVY